MEERKPTYFRMYGDERKTDRQKETYIPTEIWLRQKRKTHRGEWKGWKDGEKENK